METNSLFCSVHINEHVVCSIQYVVCNVVCIYCIMYIPKCSKYCYRKIFNNNKISGLAESTKINRRWKFIRRISLLPFSFGIINTHSDLFVIVYGLLRYYKDNLHDGSLPNPTRPLPVFHHRPSYAQNTKSKLSLIKNPCDIHVHNSLSNVAIHMPWINIHHAGRYQLEMVFTCERLRPITMDNTIHRSDCISCFCSKIKLYIANSWLISNTCTVISTWQNFHVKIFPWGTHENLFTQTFNTWIFTYTKISQFMVFPNGSCQVWLYAIWNYMKKIKSSISMCLVVSQLHSSWSHKGQHMPGVSEITDMLNLTFFTYNPT